jgi:ubiquinol-cytochrome c reductase cytochrome c1 subunit
MKEIKILAVIIGLVAVTYYGIEPYAHHVMHPEPAPVDFKFSDLKNVDTSLVGNAERGKGQFEANCIACHAAEKAGYPAMMSDADSAASYGVVPPDLSMAGHLYETNFLANFIFDPVSATHLSHKYPEGGAKVHPMPSYNWMPAQDIMDIVAFLKSIPKETFASESEEHRADFINACGRCHSMAYAGIEARTPSDTLKAYIGAAAPDLSQYIKSRGHEYLENFINDPQRLLHGTGMPRVGLTKEAQEHIVEYMEEIGDSKKAEREDLGWKVMLYMLVFAIFATLWKNKLWREVH